MEEGVTRIKVKADIYLTFDKKLQTDEEKASAILKAEMIFNNPPNWILVDKIRVHPRFHFQEHSTIF